MNRSKALDDLKQFLLKEIFVAEKSGKVDAAKFRASYYRHMTVLDELEHQGYLERRQNDYLLRLAAYREVAKADAKAGKLLEICETLFQELHKFYRDSPNTAITVQELAVRTGLNEAEAHAGLQVAVKATVFGSHTTDINDKAATVTPNESILKYGSFEEIVKQHQEWCEKKPAPSVVDLGLPHKKKTNRDVLESLLHPEIKQHAYGQYIDGHYRDSVLNSVIAIFDLIRQRTGLPDDGDMLVGKAFSLTNPYLILSEISSESGQNDQKGFMHIFKGMYQGIRNPKAHSLSHDLTEEKAAQYLVMSSLMARRIEEAKLIKK